MKTDCITGLYQSLGLSVGAEFSTEDVALLYGKVFHVPSSTDDAYAAMQKIAGGDNRWSCVGDNVLDVLLEMEKEQEKKEKHYWDLQLLNVGNLNTLHKMDKPVIMSSHLVNCPHQFTEPNTFKKVHNQSDTGSVHSCTFDADSLQRERLVGKKELYGNVKTMRRLRKAGRHCWARLMSEGVHSILLPTLWQGESPEFRGQAWGCATLSDVLLLVDVKYDVVTHLLYTEMLQEHHTLNIWEKMLPCQQHKEEEELEELAEEALESGDMLLLAELPGAFRIYRACLGASFKGCSEPRIQSWSAVSLLFDLHTIRQQEKDKLLVLGERLDGESLRLLCLYIRLATLRAQREKMSYSALLAAQQSWESWPQVKSSCKAHQAALWLHTEDVEQSRDIISMSPHQPLLQLLVLDQEQERKHLLKFMHGVSLEDLQESEYMLPPKEDSQKQTALRNGCIKKLRQIHADLQTHNKTHACGELWSQHQLEDCSLVLLTELIERHELQASAVLSTIINKSAQHVQALREEYESELQTQRYMNELQLLIPEAPFNSSSVVTPHPNITENSSNKQTAAQSCGCEPDKALNSSSGPPEALTVNLSGRPRRELSQVGTDKEDICTGCGAIIEALPYLEVLCASDATGNTPQSHSAEGGAQVEEKGSAMKSPQSFEKQDSLITLAWSKPPEDDTDYETEAAGQSQDVESCLKTQIKPSDITSTGEHTQFEETSGEREREDLKLTLVQSDSSGHHETQSTEQQCSTLTQVTLEDSAMAGQPEKTEAVSQCDLPMHALVAESLQAVQPHLLVDPSEIKWHADELCSALTSATVDVEREVVEVEIWPTAPESELADLSGPDPTPTKDQKADCSLAERESTVIQREQAREVSAIDSERTMRNLVDMQRKVEQRQKRDRKRQLLRVQERLSIIQNRKAEEDLLGLKHTDRLRHLTHDLPQEDRNQQKTVVRERLEQLKRERSHVMQSKRNRNTAGFKELLGPGAFHSRETDDGTD